MDGLMMIPSPIGRLMLCEEEGKLTGIFFENTIKGDEQERATPLLLETKRQLDEYFLGNRKEFDLPIEPKGTDFQKKVWAALCEIPYGETRSYGQVAAMAGNPKVARAVGMANHNNPISIVVP